MTDAAPTGLRRVVAALSLAVLTAALMGPALVTGAPWTFPDTPSYYEGGAST